MRDNLFNLIKTIFLFLLLFTVLFFISQYHYLLFHTLSEFFSIIIAFTFFTLAWNSRHLTKDYFYLFIGLAYFFIAFLDLLHTVTYTGMNLIKGDNTNQTLALWISARYIESLSLFIAPFFLERRVKSFLLISIYSTITIILLAVIFYWNIFPICFVPKLGLTPFKVYSEYVIIGILMVAATHIYLKREHLERKMLLLILMAITSTIISELSFTLYINMYGLESFIGHIVKIISYYLLYLALIETSFKTPYVSLFKKIKDHEKELEVAIEREKELAQLKDEFTTNVNHELKTPLTSILMTTQYLLKRIDNLDKNKIEERIKRIYHSGKSLLQLVNEILDLAKFNSNNLNCTIDRMCIRDLFQDLKKNFRDLFEGKGLEYKIKIEDDIYIENDYTHLLKIMNNLLSNAYKFTEKGYVSLEAEQDDQFVYLKVQDTGQGIDEKNFTKMFERYQQLGSAENKAPGTGIGLHLVKKLSEKHGGRVEVESELDKGSTFTVILPLVSKWK